MCGIYMIRCKTNGMLYIGGTADTFQKRFSHHLATLRRGRNLCRKLQAAFDLYGEEALEFTPLKTLDPKDIDKYEAQAIERLKPQLNIQGVCPSRRSAVVQIAGRNVTAKQLAAETGVGPQTIWARWKRGLREQELILPPHRTRRIR